MKLSDWRLIGVIATGGLSVIIAAHHGWQGMLWFVPLMLLSSWGVAADAHMRWEELLKKMR